VFPRGIQTVDGLNKTLRIAGDEFTFAGSAAKEVEIQLATASRASDRTAESFRDLLRTIGLPLLDGFGGVADGLSAIFGAIGADFEGGKLSEITDFVAAELDKLEQVFEGIALALPAALDSADISGITDGLEEIRDAVASLFGDLDLTDSEDLARAIEFIANAFRSLSEFSGGVISSFQDIAPLLAKLAESAANGEEGFKGLGEAFGRLTQVNLAAGAIGNVTSVLGDLALVIFGASQAGGLVKGTTALATSLSGPGGLVSQLGLLAGAGAAGFGLGKLANEVSRLTTGETLSQKLSDWFTGFTDLNEQALKLQDTIWPTAEQAAQDIQSLDDALNRSNQSIKESVDFWGLYGSESGTAIATIENLDEEWLAIQKATDEAADAVTNLNEETEKISLEEKLALIEANAAIATASIEADAKKLVAAFDSVGVSVESTSGLVGDLFGLLGDENISKLDKLDIRGEAIKQSERQEAALKAQERLINAQIRELNARTRAFDSGGALINVDGAGLQPHLEAFMFEILESIQVRVNAEGGELLLGAGG